MRLMLLYAPGALGPVELLRNLRPVADLVVAVPEEFRDDPGVAMLGQVLEPVFFDPLGELPDASGCDGVICYTDLLARVTAEIAHRHGLRGQSPATALALTDKDVQRRTLAEHGVDTVRSAMLRRPEDWEGAVARVGLPAVLKPCYGGGSRNTYRIDDAATGARLAGRLLAPGPGGPAETTMVLEELLIGVDQGRHGDYCSVETITVGGVMTHLPVLSKFPLAEPFRETGQFWPSHLDDHAQERAREVTEATLRALGSRDGLTSTELKLTPDGPRVIEVNSRLDGFVSELSTHSGGPNLFVTAAGVAVGEPPGIEFPNGLPLVFQLYHLGPRDAVQLLGVEGMGKVRALDGVLAYRLLLAPGAPMTPGPQSQYLSVLNATARDHDGMYALLAEVAACLTFGFRLRAADGPEVWLRGTELPSAAATAVPSAEIAP
ncbi:ATP-grasp domain-containing protein [Amycolatopsis tolypomycina]|uniref:ATP-grasp domain-containing protein n=1 Tax=Amycolatopsis tolypomycina TaxID=208445 RepID=A0A1H4VXZ1_9PSEU|nr:hypothetical protein [Amycolatopsis tolypomycina]SEC85308.1 hypothetical protein SAMN04489727_5338 [Amycolatopsis tolypomycina]